MFVKKCPKTPRFEVDYKTRLEQQQTAINAVRLPCLGFRQYRVYDLKKSKHKVTFNNLYAQSQVARGIRKGQITIAGGSAVLYPASQVWTIFLDELTDPPYKVKWLRPKHVTFLQLQGHRVEEVV